MRFQLSKQDIHASELLGRDTVALCKKMGFSPRLENDRQSREEANILGFKAEFAVARLLGLDTPTLNVLSDGGVDLWAGDVSIDVKFTNKERGPLIFDSMDKFKATVAVLVGATDDPSVMRINGAITREKFEWACYRHDFGHGEREVMDADALYPIEWLWLNLMKKKYGAKNGGEMDSNE